MNILVVRLDNMGDIIITSGIACKIKEKYPTANIAYLVRKVNVSLLQAHGSIDNIIAYDTEKNICDLISDLRSCNFDYIIDLSYKSFSLPLLDKVGSPIIRRVKRSAIECMLNFIPFIVKLECYKHVNVVSLRNNFLVKCLLKMHISSLNYVKNNRLVCFKRFKKLHESQLSELLLFPLGITNLTSVEENSNKIANNFKVVGDIPTELTSYFLQSDKINLVIHPGSNGHGREWPALKYIELVHSLDKNRYNIFITGSKQEGLSHIKAISDNCSEIIDLSGKFSLKDFMLFLTKVDALIASGTGPLHLAAAVGAHAIGLFPTQDGINSSRWRPLGRNVTVFEEHNMENIKSSNIKDALEKI